MSKGYKGVGMEGAVARWYDKTTRKDMQAYVSQARRIDAMLPEGSSILEVATGPGFVSIELARGGRHHVTGLDISRTMVELAVKNAATEGVEVSFQQGNASALPFADASFDFVVCRAAFKNFSEPVKAIQEMRRVLRPGAQGVIVDLCRDTSMTEISNYVDGMETNVLNGLAVKATFRFLLLPRAYTVQQFRDMLRQASFTQTWVEQASIGLEAWFKK